MQWICTYNLWCWGWFHFCAAVKKVLSKFCVYRMFYISSSFHMFEFFFITFQFGKNSKKRIKTSSRHIIWDWCWSTKLLNLMNCLSNKCSWCVKFIQPVSLPYLLLMVLISHHVRLLSPSCTCLLFLIHDGLAS